MGAKSAVLGFIEGLADTTSSLLKPIVGHWASQTKNKKPFLTVGYGLTAFSRPFIGLMVSPIAVALLRLVDRIGKGIRTAPRDAMIATSVPESHRGRAFGYHRSMDHLGAAIGPVLAFLFLACFPTSVRELFLLTLIPGAIMMLVLVVGLRSHSGIGVDGDPECGDPSDAQTNPSKEGDREQECLGESTSDRSRTPREEISDPSVAESRRRDFGWFLVAILTFSFANTSDLFLLAQARAVGVGEVWLPILWTMLHVFKSMGNRVGGMVADRFPPKRLIVGGWLFYAIVYALFGIANQPWHIWFLFACYASFFALTEPSEKKLVAQFVVSRRLDSGYGWFHFMLGIAYFPANVLFGVVHQYGGASIAFGGAAGLAIVAAIVLVQVDGNRTLEPSV